MQNDVEKQLNEGTPDEVSYNESDIQVLEGLEAVRKRPGMYIGSTGPRGLHHLVYEIVDNSIDEALAGYCTHIEVDILPGDIISVRDNGRGIPVGINEKLGLPAVTVVLTVLHAGGKFGGGGYKVAGGLHGVGSSVVNALSQWLEVEVSREGHTYQQRFEQGKTVTDLKIIADTEATGTLVRFKADPTIFTETTETLVQYPFSFEFRIVYTLDKDSISVEYRTTNKNDKDMYYSVGCHEAYLCPEGIENYSILIDKKDTLDSHIVNGNLMDYKTERILEDSDVLELKYDYFSIDALVFSKFNSSCVTLCSKDGERIVKVDFPEFTHLLFWTKNCGNAP